MTQNTTNGYLPKKMFYWIMGVIIAVMMAITGYLVARVDAVTETFNHNFTTVKTDISSIQTDIEWIKYNI